jgi:zinc D-Ala-D-Ala carboxypeptidase
MERISKYVSYNEGVRSQTATRKGIKNTPTATELLRMKKVATEVFDKVREHFGIPLYVSSFFRCKELNTSIGGSKTSQHMSGEAIDIDADGLSITNKQIYDYIKDNLDFDQLIWEYGTDKNPEWVHVSYKYSGKNRKQILRIK